MFIYFWLKGSVLMSFFIKSDRLLKLHNMNILEYLPQNSTPKIFFSMARVDAKMLPISKEILVKRKSIEEGKAAVIVAYVQNKYRCRSSFLLDYFGEEKDKMII